MLVTLIVFGMITLTATGPADAAEIKIEPNGVRVSGQLVNGDDLLLREALTRSRINTVRFENCQGGSIIATSRIMQLVHDLGTRTVAVGGVFSGCALAFLAGHQRRIERSPLRPSYIGLHGAYDQNGKRSEAATLEVLRWIRQATRNRMPAELIDKVYKSPIPASGLYLYLPFSRQSIEGDVVEHTAYYCKGNETNKPEDCERIGTYRLDWVGIVDAI